MPLFAKSDSGTDVSTVGFAQDLTMHIATPCHADWNQMSKVGVDRHCSACNHLVFDLTPLAPAALRSRMNTIADTVANGGRVCIRGRLDRDGMLAGSRRVLTGGMAVILAMTIAGCQGDGPEIARDPATTAAVAEPPEAAPQTREIMGDAVTLPMAMGIACVPPPPPVTTVGKPAMPPAPHFAQ